MFDDMIAEIEFNKKLSLIVTEFCLRKKTQHSTYFYITILIQSD